ncbi:MAG: acetylglutamate kinase [Euryarchaeota archaeon]|nr:acetylglutamate kinase [Euryarchaeota archaeon]
MIETNRAEILAEALPYIERFQGAYVVIKYGGHAMLDPQAKDWTVRDTILLKYVGMKPVIVHGGGPEISAAMEKMGKEPEFIEGLRVTDEETLDIVKMVLVGKINTDIVSRISASGSKAVGLSGKDGGLLMARKKGPAKIVKEGVEKEVDLGLVGETEEINPEIIETLTSRGYIPVVSPIGLARDGSSLNLNADTVAGDLACALKARKLIVLTDVPGILRDIADEKSLIRQVRVNELEDLLKDGIVTGSMIPKVNACAAAIEGGVEKCHIIDGRVRHSILLELFTDQGVGTMIVGD